MGDGHDAYEDAVTDPANRAMRKASGQVDDSRPIVTFLYLLGRGHLPLGVIEEIVREVETSGGGSQFTNGWLAQWAAYEADRMGVGVDQARADPIEHEARQIECSGSPLWVDMQARVLRLDATSLAEHGVPGNATTIVIVNTETGEEQTWRRAD